MNWTIKDKAVLVTGGSSGIGLATARQLANLGAKVTITSRSAEKAEAAAHEIKEATGANVTSLQLELSSLSSIDAFVEQYLKLSGQLDVLINNAGTISGKRQTTNEGFELTFASNYVGPFYLTSRLLPLITKSANGRIINVSSELYRNAKGGLDFDNLQLERGFSSSRAYANSKLALMLFTYQLASRFPEIKSFAVHPGVIKSNFGTAPDSGLSMSLMMKLLGPFLKKPDHGAGSSVLLATAASEELSSSWYWSEGKPVEPLEIATNPEVSKELWAITEDLIREAKKQR